MIQIVPLKLNNKKKIICVDISNKADQQNNIFNIKGNPPKQKKNHKTHHQN